MIRLAMLAAIVVMVAVACGEQHRRQSVSAPLPGGMRGTVRKVTDGDTIHVTVQGKDVDVRLIGINTPETVKPGTPVMCGGREASANMHQLAPAGAPARVVPDPSTGEGPTDKYGRTLAYVYVGRVNVNAAQVRAGWAEVNGYGHPFRLHALFDRLARRARAAGRGVYGLCGGDFHRPAGGSNAG